MTAGEFPNRNTISSSRARILFLAATLWSVSTCCLAADQTKPAPEGYYGDDSGEASALCQKKFTAGSVMPSTTVEHTYLLLLAFDNEKDSEAAGVRFFEMPRKQSGNTNGKETYGCIADPEPTAKINPLPPGWGLIVKNCPTDCWGIMLQQLRDSSGGIEDPLKGIPKTHWGIFRLSDSGEVSNTKSGFQVWQIRARNAVHAGLILKALAADGIEKAPGYMGHIMIGYRPVDGEQLGQRTSKSSKP